MSQLITDNKRLSDALESLKTGLNAKAYKSFLKRELSIDVTRELQSNKHVNQFMRLQLSPDALNAFPIVRWSESEQKYTPARVVDSLVDMKTDSYLFKVTIDQYTRNSGQLFGETRSAISRGKLPPFYAALDLVREQVVLLQWDAKALTWESFKLGDATDVSISHETIEIVTGNAILALMNEYITAFKANKPSPYARPDMSPLRAKLAKEGHGKDYIDTQIAMELQGWRNRKNAKDNPKNKIYQEYKDRNKVQQPDGSGTAVNADGTLKTE